MPEPGSSRSASATQAYRSSGDSSPGTTASRSDARASEPRRVTVSVAELVGHVGGDPLVGGRGGGEHRGARREAEQRPGQPLVVGAEVEAPVRDAVRLVDHQQPDGAEQVRQLAGESRVGQPLGGDQQHVESARTAVGRAPRPSRRRWSS